MLGRSLGQGWVVCAACHLVGTVREPWPGLGSAALLLPSLRGWNLASTPSLWFMAQLEEGPGPGSPRHGKENWTHRPKSQSQVARWPWAEVS